MPIKIALTGNPNCGKTTMFNDLTGSSQYVGNWPGVTVEKKEGKLKGHKDVIVQDLPRIYSLSPYTLEEVVSRNYLIEEKPDAVIDIVDGSNIERNLYLTTQLTELGLPVVMALNMIDIVKKNGDTIDTKKLGELMGCRIVETSAVQGVGSKEVAQAALEMARNGEIAQPKHAFSGNVEHAVAHIEDLLGDAVDSKRLRFFAIKLFERDAKVLEGITLAPDVADGIEQIIRECEEKMDDDSESIITNERYAYIARVMDLCVKKSKKQDDLS